MGHVNQSRRLTIADPMSKKRFFSITIWTLIFVATAGMGRIKAAPLTEEITGNIRQRLDSSGKRFSVHNRRLTSRQLVRLYYQRRDYKPVWQVATGPGKLAGEMKRAIQLAQFDGLDPADYHFRAISQIFLTLAGSPSDSEHVKLQADLDLLLTDAFLQLGRHLQGGKTATLTKEISRVRDMKLLGGLDRAAQTGRVFTALDGLKAGSSEYEMLRQALGRYLRIEKKGGWAAIPQGEDLEYGNYDGRIPLIVNRLLLTGDLKSDLTAPERERQVIFNRSVELAVLRFQGRHGLRKNGRLDRKTRLAMNVPLRKRILQIRLNMDLRRRLPENSEKRWLIVNIPSTVLKVVQAGKKVMNMRVIVGRPEQQTPVFSDSIPFLIVNPFWYIPPAIVEREILPAMKKNPDYLAVRGIRLFKKMSADKEEIRPENVDWQSLSPDAVDFYFRQDPGWDNSLGSVKFIIPNREHIYLHDTPSRGLFQRRFRALSFGCVRVEQPLELAAFMLEDDPRWPKSKIRRLMNSGQQLKIVLPQPLPVHVVYWTVQVDGRNRLKFLSDIYDLESDLISKLTG